MSADTRPDDMTRLIALGPVFGAGPGLRWGFGERVALITNLSFAYAPFWADDLNNDEGFEREAHSVSLGVNMGLSVDF